MQFRKSTLANSVKLAADACALATHGREMVAFFYFFFIPLLLNVVALFDVGWAYL